MGKPLAMAVAAVVAAALVATEARGERVMTTWHDLVASSELVASADLVRVDGDLQLHNFFARFLIREVFKGRFVKQVDVSVDGTMPDDRLDFNQLGEYILFLKRPVGEHYANYEVQDERFLKVRIVSGKEQGPVSVIDEAAYRHVIAMPKDLFTDLDLQVKSYGKTVDIKARVIETSVLKAWLRKHAPGMAATAGQ